VVGTLNILSCSFGRVQSQASDYRLFKHCEVTVAMDGSEDLLIHCLKPNQPFAAVLDRHRVVLQLKETGSL